MSECIHAHVYKNIETMPNTEVDNKQQKKIRVPTPESAVAGLERFITFLDGRLAGADLGLEEACVVVRWEWWGER